MGTTREGVMSPPASALISSLALPSLFLGAFCLRLAAGFVRFRDTSWWEEGYSFYGILARNIAVDHAFHLGAELAPRPPLYPLLLAGEFAVGGASNLLPIFVQATIGAGTVLLVFLLAREIFDRPVAMLAALIVAIYPYYVAHDTAQQETVLFTFLTTGAVYALVKAGRSGSAGDHALAGCWLGLDVLCREMIVPFVPLALAWLFCYQKAAPRRQVLSKVAVGLGTMLLLVTPWLARNAMIYGSPVLSAGEGFGLGFHLWAGFNEFTLAHYPWESIDKSTALAYERLSLSERAELESLDERSRGRWFMRRALDFMRRYPMEAAKYTVVKIFAGIGPVLSPATGPWWRVAVHAASYAPLLLLAIAGAVLARGKWRELCLIYLLAASFLLVAVAVMAHTSHRSYLDVYIAILASYAIVNGRQRWRRLPFPVRRRPC